MAYCTVCNRKLGFFENLVLPHPKRCPACSEHIQNQLHAAMHYLGKTFADGGISAEVEQQFLQSLITLKLPDSETFQIRERLVYLRYLSEVRWGNVPIIRTDIHLDSDEYAHFDMPATYYKENNRVEAIAGRLVGTNKKCYFLATNSKGSTTIDWNNVSLTEERNFTYYHYVNRQQKIPLTKHVLHITVSKGSGGGNYGVQDPYATKIVIDALVKLWKRQLVIYQETKTYGPVPEHVKATVFKRDGGKCVQCGYMGEYIEYDHIIPRSKGGPNTVDNIQLLCRKCNGKKSNRI